MNDAASQKMYVAPIAVCESGHVLAEGEGQWVGAHNCVGCDALVPDDSNFCSRCAYPQKASS